MTNPTTPEPFEDPLEALLDEESDEEFGLPEFRSHFADDLQPAKLKDWTAQDFASIYVRFKPHLDRHARRFLRDQIQVEEVVQDAFLYLMTTLPELDSELGVLKFLKWKVRLLSLDVIRASSRNRNVPIGENEEFESKGPTASEQVERAEDAAIVQMALAKLQPRHREVLIATVYEEKATEVVAAQMGLSENATRQLVFRARSAFKRALIGEAETAGLSMGQILSIAARKAAKDAGKQIAAVGTFLLVLITGFALWPRLAPVDQLAIDPEPTTTNSAQPFPTPSPTGSTPSVIDPTASPDASPDGNQSVRPTPRPTPTPSPSESVVEIEFGTASLVDIDTEQSKSGTEVPTQHVSMVDTEGRLIEFDLNPGATNPFSNTSVEFRSGGEVYRTLQIEDSFIDYLPETRTYIFDARLGYLYGTDGTLVENSEVSNSRVYIEVRLNKDFTKIELYSVAFLAQ